MPSQFVYTEKQEGTRKRKLKRYESAKRRTLAAENRQSFSASSSENDLTDPKNSINVETSKIEEFQIELDTLKVKCHEKCQMLFLFRCVVHRLTKSF